MGNRSRLTPNFKDYGSNQTVNIDTESGILTEDILNDMIKQSLANIGQPNHIFFPAAQWNQMGWDVNPEYKGTPWVDTVSITKRERRVAGLHTTLSKIGALPKMSPEDFNEVVAKSTKRLKRAKWASYNRKKTP